MALVEEESSINNVDPMVENGVEYPFGTETEIFRIGGTELWVLEYRNGGGGGGRAVKTLRTGEFAVRVARHAESPLGVSLCSVGDHHWPLARDGPVVRVGSHRFAFALPEYLTICALKLPGACSDDDLKKLQGILLAFSAYADHYAAGNTTSVFNFPSKSETGFWALASTTIQSVMDAMLAGIVTGDYRDQLRRPKDMAHTVLRAVRISAMTKLVTQTLIRGAIKFHSHVQLVGPRAKSRTVAGSAQAAESPVFPSMSTFADVLGAVETYGESIDGWDQVGPSRARCWKINKVGLTLLLRIVLAGSGRNTTTKPTGADVGEGEGERGGGAVSVSDIRKGFCSALPN